MKKKLINWLLNRLLPNLLNSVSTESVLKVVRGGTYLGNEKITQAQADNLALEAKRIEATRLWQVMMETLKNDANQKMFTNSVSFDDMWAGKMMIYNLSVLDKIISTCKQLSKPSKGGGDSAN